MKYFDWDERKDSLLKEERGISFEEIVIAIYEGKLLATVNHPNQKWYPNQKIYIINIEDYAYMVPFIEDEKKYFLKTIIPSRKMTKKYLTER